MRASDSISSTLSQLLRQKSERDGKEFTAYQLAKELNIKRSVLHRLMHHDPKQRVDNPRVGTLSKIVDFFNRDGFYVTIDDFIGSKHIVDVRSQNMDILKNVVSIPIYSIYNPSRHTLGSVTLKTSSNSNSLFALELQEPIGPIFDSGSILIIDKSAIPNDRNLVAVTTKDSQSAAIWCYRVIENRAFLESITNKPDNEHQPVCHEQNILGVIIQINTKCSR